MKPLIDWLDHRAGARELLRSALYEHIPGGARWRYVWGSTLVFAFTVQAITGIFLWMAYSPSTQTAWESVFYIQYEMQGGWLLRGLHHFMAQAMVVLLVLHLMQVVIDGAYKAPREVNFWLGLVLMQIVLGLSLTGYLLPWDQKGFSATKVATNIMALAPGAGPVMQRLVVGGTDYGHHTLTRFFALHAGVLPGMLVFFLVLHVALFRRHGIHVAKKGNKPDSAFWPDQVLKDAVACLAVLAVVLFLIFRYGFTGSHGDVPPGEYLGAELGAPADVARSYAAARPEWYFLFLFQFLKYFPGEREVIGAIVIPGVLMGILFLMPFIGRWKLGHGFNVLFLLCILVGAGALTVQAMYQDAHDESYQVAVADAEVRAVRARQLALTSTRIPPSGAVTLLRDDPLLAGAELFKTHCASCHAYADAEGHGMSPEKTATASNLYGFASREWIAGVLDPAQVGGPRYFGNTAHTGEAGEMAAWVKENVPGMDEQQKAELKDAVIALSAQARLPSQAEADQQDAAKITAGVELLKNKIGCTDCHRFDDVGELGTAPELTGYGSREWLSGIIANPAHERFYGDTNDRMPAFAPAGADAPAQEQATNRLSHRDIGLIVDWLRGDYLPAAH